MCRVVREVGARFFHLPAPSQRDKRLHLTSAPISHEIFPPRLGRLSYVNIFCTVGHRGPVRFSCGHGHHFTASRVHGRPAGTPTNRTFKIGTRTTRPKHVLKAEKCSRQDTVTAPATSLPAGKEKAPTRSNTAAAGTSTLPATTLPFISSASTTEAASATVSAPTADENGARNGGDTNAVGDGVAKATSTTLPYGQGEEEAEARAERSGVANSTISATAKPFAPSSYTREAASAARDAWMEIPRRLQSRRPLRTTGWPLWSRGRFRRCCRRIVAGFTPFLGCAVNGRF